MIDLSHLALDGPWVTSQAAGNMTASNAGAMTGPGSPPVDPAPSSQGDPHVTASGNVPVGTPPERAPRGFTAAGVAWTAID